MAKRTWKNAPARQSARPVKRAPSQPKVTSLPVPTSTFKPSGDTRRDSLMRQIESAQQALNRESASGFGDRSERAAKHLDSLNKQLSDYDASGFGPKAVEISKTAVPAVIGGVAGVKVASSMGSRSAAVAQTNIQRFNQLAKQVERIRTNTPKNIVGSKAGDKMIALVNEGFVLGGRKAPLTSTGVSRAFQSARPLFAKAGGKFGAGLVLGLAAEGIASRYVLPNYTTDPVLKESLAITGTASLAAAVTYTIKRKIDIAKPGLKPAATEIAKVTAAHGQIVREVGGAGLKRTGRALAFKAASRVVLPVAVGAAAVLAYSKSSRAGESKSRAFAKAVVAGADEATLGVTSGANRALSGHGGVSGFISNVVVRGVRTAGATVSALRVQIARRGAVQAVARKVGSSRRGGAPIALSNGSVKGYYRQQAGKSVFVQGYSRA